MLYFALAAVFILGVFAVVFVPPNLSLIVFGSAVGTLLIGSPIVSLIKWNGKRAFRDSWKQEHTGPTYPVQAV